MPDNFVAFVHELGKELFGVQYVWMKPHVERWASVNPERIAWLERRMRRYVEARR